MEKEPSSGDPDKKEEKEFVPPWREHDPNEKIEGEVFWVSCNYCGFDKYVDMGEGSSSTREEITQAFWKEHDKAGRTGGINNIPCPSSDFKIENADDKKQFFRKKGKK